MQGFDGGDPEETTSGGGRPGIEPRPELSVPNIDVVVITWNDGPLLARALGSVLGCKDVITRIIVVDNGSTPPAELPQHPRIVTTRNPDNRGVAAGRNQGARLGTAPLICFLDSDAALRPQSLRRLADAALANEDIAMAVPVYVDQAPEASAGRAPGLVRKLARMLGLWTEYGRMAGRDRAGTWDVDFGIGACQLVRRKAFDAVAGLDESYFYGPEDVDFCLRLREAGWRVVQVSDAPVDHPPRRRNRQLLTRRGAQHAWAVCRHLWRHRRFQHRAIRSTSRTIDRSD